MKQCKSTKIVFVDSRPGWTTNMDANPPEHNSMAAKVRKSIRMPHE
jgi:hypothetical protein